MSSDSSSNYDVNVLYDDDELISRSDSQSSDTEAESTHCFRTEQPDFIPSTSQKIERHKPNCNKNFTGSSQAMEPEAAERIWSRSLERNLVYSVYVGDGDGKASSK